MTVQFLELANPSVVMDAVERTLSPSLKGIMPSGDIVNVVGQALKLSRAVAEDGKGFTISYLKSKSGFPLRTSL